MRKKGNRIKPITLVLLPGLDGTGILFQPFIDALPASFKPIVVAYPLERHLTYQELLPIVRGALPSSDPFILLGESFSGPVAVMAAAERPKNLIGLVLCASFVVNPLPMMGPVMRLLARGPVLRLIPKRRMVKSLLDGYATPELLILLARVHALVRPDVMAARMRMSFRVDVSAALRTCDVPMLYLAGTKDRMVPARSFQQAQRINPGIRRVMLAAPHMVLQACPRAAAEAISIFAGSQCANE